MKPVANSTDRSEKKQHLERNRISAICARVRAMAHIRDTNVVSRMESLHVDEARDVASRRRISSPRKRYNPPARSATKIVGKRDDQRSARYHANVLWSVVRCSVCWKEPTLSALLFFLRPLLTALSTPTEKRERERKSCLRATG